MRIIRFLDENAHTCFGYNYGEGTATLLEGDIFRSLQDTGKRKKVHKLLAPIQILCIVLTIDSM